MYENVRMKPIILYNQFLKQGEAKTERRKGISTDDKEDPGKVLVGICCANIRTYRRRHSLASFDGRPLRLPAARHKLH
jgi:hypothetical protein